MTFRTIELTCSGVARALFSRLGRAGLPVASVAGAFFLVAIATSHSARGAAINYGDFNGVNVKFLDVTESSDDPLPLYGAPTVSGDSLSFSPQQFFAKSQFGVPVNDTTDGQLTFMVEADAGAAVTDIHFTEGGSLSVTGLSSATNDTYVDVSAPGFITVTAVDGVGINPVSIPVDFKFNFGVGGNGTWRKVSEGTVNGFLWSGGQLLDITQELINRGLNPQVGATKLSVNLDNILFAQSEPVGSARIDKKLFLEITTTIPDDGGEPFIPEPASMIMVICGAIGGFLVRGRRES